MGFSTTGFDQLCAASRNTGSCACNLARIAQDIAGRGSSEAVALGRPPKVSTEGLDNLWQRLASSADPNAKKIGLFLLGVAFQKYVDKIEDQQEVVASITDVLMNAYAIESSLLRARLQPAHGSP